MKQKRTVLVCVTDQKNCERLIKAGHMLAKSQDMELKVLSVQSRCKLKKIEQAPLEYLFNVCKSLDAEMKVYWSDNVNNVVHNYILSNRVAELVVGVPEKMMQGNFVYDVHQAFPDIPISVIDESNLMKTLSFQEV
ncbi:adenine nucleotide alpha hydrolase family protein [Geosporobacter ferrireducens]|uniref:hypothetical protein n=1 Tax=Geosporobacter ferrireducens TaxID=1424294 RepID=UPI001F4911BC|nr:hypothetical protein [Geosporobacter ferrireducens]